MYTESEIRAVVEQNARYHLRGWETVQKYTIATLHEIYNGAGPDSWYPALRDTLTKAMKLFKPVILVHDVQFNESDGSREGFERARDNWIYNCQLIFDTEFPLFTWKQLDPNYRKNRAYWYGVMKAGNAAISGDSAFKAWQAAAANAKGKKA